MTRDFLGRIKSVFGKERSGHWPQRYVADIAPIPKEFDLHGIRLPDGLLLMFRSDDSPQCETLTTFWSHREAFDRSIGRLLTSLPGAGVIRAGVVGNVVEPAQSWFETFPIGKVLLAAAAIAGALEVLSSRVEQFVASPAISLDIDGGKLGRKEIIEGEDDPLNVGVANRSGVKQRFVEVQAVARKVSPAGAVSALPMPGADRRELRPWDAYQVSIGLDGLTAGEWEIAVIANARAGYLRPEDPPIQATRPLKVWPRLPQSKEPTWIPLPRKAGEGESAIELKGTVLVGAPAAAGLDCGIWIKEVPQLRREGFAVSPMQKSEFESGNDSPATLAKDARFGQHWTTYPIAGRQLIIYALYLRAPQGTNWSEVSKNTVVHCRVLPEVRKP